MFEPSKLGAVERKRKRREQKGLVCGDIVLPDLKSPTRAALESMIKGYIIGRTELVGRYQRL